MALTLAGKLMQPIRSENDKRFGRDRKDRRVRDGLDRNEAPPSGPR